MIRKKQNNRRMREISSKKEKRKGGYSTLDLVWSIVFALREKGRGV